MLDELPQRLVSKACRVGSSELCRASCGAELVRVESVEHGEADAGEERVAVVPGLGVGDARVDEGSSHRN